MKKQSYWFRVKFGKWLSENEFDPEDSCIYVEAWNALQALKKAQRNTDYDPSEVIISVEYLGYPQI